MQSIRSEYEPAFSGKIPHVTVAQLCTALHCGNSSGAQQNKVGHVFCIFEFELSNVGQIIVKRHLTLKLNQTDKNASQNCVGAAQ
jgi:hypothetical protein